MEAFNPYYEWLGISDDVRRPNHYQLLGIPLFEETPRVIENAADRQMAHLRTFQTGSRKAESQRMLNEVSAAKLCLLKPADKINYDASLRTSLAGEPSGMGPADQATTTTALPQAVSIPSLAFDPYSTTSSTGRAARKGRAATDSAARGGKGSRSAIRPLYLGVALGIGFIAAATVIWLQMRTQPRPLGGRDQSAIADAGDAKVSHKPKPTGNTRSAKQTPIEPTTLVPPPPAPKVSDDTKIESPVAAPSPVVETRQPTTIPRPELPQSPPPTVSEPSPKEPETPRESVWIALTPLETSSSMGAVFELQPDAVIFVSGGNGPGFYTIKAKTKLTQITGVRLEALADTRLPNHGPGRAVNGNFVLTDFKITATSLKDSTLKTEVHLVNARSDFSQGGFSVVAAVDSDSSTGWAVASELGKSHVAVFDLDEPVGIDGGTVLTIVMGNEFAGGLNPGTLSLGKFRLAITASPLPLSLSNSVPLRESKIDREPGGTLTRSESTPQDATFSDAITAKLDRAKQAWQEEMEKYNASVASFLKKRELAAQKSGKRKMIEQIEAQRQAFEENDESPSGFPAMAKTRLVVARNALLAAYQAAIRDYTKAGRDAQASAIEQEYDALKEKSRKSAKRQ